MWPAGGELWNQVGVSFFPPSGRTRRQPFAGCSVESTAHSCIVSAYSKTFDPANSTVLSAASSLNRRISNKASQAKGCIQQAATTRDANMSTHASLTAQVRLLMKPGHTTGISASTAERPKAVEFPRRRRSGTFSRHYAESVQLRPL